MSAVVVVGPRIPIVAATMRRAMASGVVAAVARSVVSAAVVDPSATASAERVSRCREHRERHCANG